MANIDRETTDYLHSELNKSPEIQLLFYIYVNGQHKRTFVNDIQINEFCKQVWNREELSTITIEPTYGKYVNVK